MNNFVFNPPMFDSDTHDEHVGNDKPLTERLNCLKEVEKYFIDRCVEKKIFWSFDCTGEESHNFKTLNYSSYAGLFIMHPLHAETSMLQMHEALFDNENKLNFSEFIIKNYNENNANKYNYQREQFNKNIDALVVLPGENKIRTNICLNKLKWIIAKHGKKVVIKPHPLTRPQTIDELCKQLNINGDYFAPINSDLYFLHKKASVVYTTHISETALYSVLLNKAISPIDAIQARIPGSFTHINHYFFTNQNAKMMIDKMFSSYKSGVVHPEIDKNWKEKIDKYIQYISNVRERQKYFYILG